MSLEMILAELPQLTMQERQIIGDMIWDLSDESSLDKGGPSEASPALPAGDYWAKVFSDWPDKEEEGLPDDLSLNHEHYTHGVPKQW